MADHPEHEPDDLIHELHLLESDLRDHFGSGYHVVARAIAEIQRLRGTARQALDVGFDSGADWGIRNPEGGRGSHAAMDRAWAQHLAELAGPTKPEGATR